MSEKDSMQTSGSEPVPRRTQLAVRIPASTHLMFKLACVRAGITIQDGTDEALLRWIQDRASEATDE